jgi:hypothetical protein
MDSLRLALLYGVIATTPSVSTLMPSALSNEQAPLPVHSAGHCQNRPATVEKSHVVGYFSNLQPWLLVDRRFPFHLVWYEPQ